MSGDFVCKSPTIPKGGSKFHQKVPFIRKLLGIVEIENSQKLLDEKLFRRAFLIFGKYLTIYHKLNLS